MRHPIRLWLFAFCCLMAAGLVSCSPFARFGLYQYTRNTVYQPAAQAPVYPVYVDKQFSGDDRLAIQDALQQWDYALNGHARFVIVDTSFDMEMDKLQRAQRDDAFLIMMVHSDNPIIPTNIAPGQWCLGWTPYTGSHWIRLVRDRLDTSTDVKLVLMHEIGHALGADHDGSGLMYNKYSPEQYQCVDYGAVVQVARWYHWDVHTLNYCQVGESSTHAIKK